MQKFVDKMAEWSDKLSQSFILKVIMNGFVILLPLTMIGSIASLINGITISGFQEILAASGIGAVLTAIYQFTTGGLALYLAFGIANAAANQLDLKKQSVSAGIVSIASFLVITPLEEGMISTQWIGATGMFSAIVVGFITAGIYKFCLAKKITIRLPKQVPPMVSNQFTAIIPALFTIIFFGIVNYAFSFTTFGSFHNLIYTLLGMPLRALGSSIWGVYVLTMFTALLWFFGIHGGMIMMNMMMLVFMPLQMENLAAYQAGQELPHMVTGNTLSLGNGSLVILIVLLAIAKSKTARSVSKLAIIPSFFGIDEPAYFGLPMIMNPIFFIPWVIIWPFVSVFGTYFLNVTGLLPYASGAFLSSNLPFFVTNFVSYGWRGVVWGFVLLAVTLVLIFPFVKAYDRQMLKREMASDSETEENEN